MSSSKTSTANRSPRSSPMMVKPLFAPQSAVISNARWQRENVVISTGGGAPAFEEVWTDELLGHPETLTVTLDARPETIHARLGRAADSRRQRRRAADAGGRRSHRAHRLAQIITPRLLRSLGRDLSGRPSSRPSMSAIAIHSLLDRDGDPTPVGDSSMRPRVRPRSTSSPAFAVLRVS